MAAAKAAQPRPRPTRSKRPIQGRSARSSVLSWARDDRGARHFETEIGSRREVGEERLAQFLLVVRLERLRLRDIRRAPCRGGNQRHRLLVVKLKIDEKNGGGHPQGEELCHRRRRLQRQGNMELD